jgi:hypothetical protein
MTHFNDVIDETRVTGESLGDAIWRDAFRNVQPITERTRRLQMLGPCPDCGEREFVCDCDINEIQRAESATQGLGGANNPAQDIQ